MQCSIPGSGSTASAGMSGGGGVKRCGFLIALVLLLVCLLEIVDATPLTDARRGGGRYSEDGSRGAVHLRTKHEWKRRHRKASECKLGKERYSINESWSPNLGPPFGVWSCVKCQCIKVQKKRRWVAKVRCRNVKNECPKVECTNAVILPGACCKTCVASPPPLLPAQDEAPEDLTGKDFAVLLNGRTSQTPMTTSRVATGRLSLRRGTLHFSFLLEEGAPAPESIQFMTDTGDILEILEFQPTPYEATNNRLCGTWTRMPKEYKALLREEKIWVALYPPEDSGEDVISGLVARYTGVDTEVFSSLLIPSPAVNQTLSGGGTAIISVDRKTDSLHVSLVFNGIFGPSESHNATVSIQLMPSRAMDPVTDTVVLSKVATDLNRVEYMTTLGDSSLRLLTRGLVSMKIWSLGAPNFALEGLVTSRVTCNVFSTVLSLPEPERMEGTIMETEPLPPPPYGAGWALFTVSNEGDFDYQIYVKGIPVGSLKLETQHRKGHRIVEDLTPNISENWVNGTYSRPTYRDLDALLRGKMEVVVYSRETEQPTLKGMLNQVAVTEALRSPLPVLLSSSEMPMAATVWIAVDSACVTHYDVMIGGPPPPGTYEPLWNLILRENDTSFDPRLDMTKMELETEVTGRELFAHSTQLNRLSLSRLGAGVTYLDLTLNPSSNDTSLSPLTGLVKGVNVPEKCLLDSDDVNPPPETIHPDDTPGSLCNDDNVCIHQSDNSVKNIRSHKCIDEENRIFEDGSSWRSPVNSCSMCMCTKGEIRCEDVMCPEVTCEGAEIPLGHCCPVCPREHTVSSTDRMCQLNDQRYSIGAVWYPFLAPKGFDKCVTCTCQASPSGDPSVNCARISCPTLHCDERMIEHNPDSCCPRCKPPSPKPTVSTDPEEPGVINNPPLTDDEYKAHIIEQGGCMYRQEFLAQNGEEWHPRVASFGIYQCITCKCKNGVVTCNRMQCPTLTCQTMVQVDVECCPRCQDTIDSTHFLPKPRRKSSRSNKPKKSSPRNRHQRRNSG